MTPGRSLACSPEHRAAIRHSGHSAEARFAAVLDRVAFSLECGSVPLFRPLQTLFAANKGWWLLVLPGSPLPYRQQRHWSAGREGRTSLIERPIAAVVRGSSAATSGRLQSRWLGTWSQCSRGCGSRTCPTARLLQRRSSQPHAQGMAPLMTPEQSFERIRQAGSEESSPQTGVVSS